MLLISISFGRIVPFALHIGVWMYGQCEVFDIGLFSHDPRFPRCITPQADFD